MLKHFVETGRPQMTILRMRVACWVPEATNIHPENAIFIDFPLQQWSHEHASMLRHTYTPLQASIFSINSRRVPLKCDGTR